MNMIKSSRNGNSAVLRRLTVHDDFFDGLPPGDGDDDPFWQGVPPEHRSELAGYAMLCATVHLCRAEEATGDRYRLIEDCPGGAEVLDAALERGAAAIRAEGGAGIARLMAEFDAELRRDWPRRLPRPPDDDDDDRAS
jgi:hypothetical protein